MNNFNEIVGEAKKYIEDNIKLNISPEETAKVLNYSLRQLNRIFSLSTGLTLAEYIRWSKLAKAFFEVKNSDNPLIDIALKYGYETQEGFTRAFKENFTVTPGDYRKTKQSITAKNWHVNEFIHKEAHDASNKGAFTRGHVDNWIVVKPERLWVSFRKNVENLPPYKFFDLCAEEGVMKKSNAFPNAGLEYGAYLPPKQNSRLSFGLEVELDYPNDLLNEYEVIRIPQSKYVVFNYPKYSIDKHGDAIRSTWSAQRDFDIEAHGLRWNLDNAPIFEGDDKEIGYILWFPVCDLEKSNTGEPIKTSYKFNDLQMSFKGNIGYTVYFIDGNGALNIEFNEQYNEITYTLPHNINLADYMSITVNGISADGNTAVKFYNYTGQEVFVMYNNKCSAAADWIYNLKADNKNNNIKTIGIMSQDTGKQLAVINSVTFKKED